MCVGWTLHRSSHKAGENPPVSSYHLLEFHLPIEPLLCGAGVPALLHSLNEKERRTGGPEEICSEMGGGICFFLPGHGHIPFCCCVMQTKEKTPWHERPTRQPQLTFQRLAAMQLAEQGSDQTVLCGQYQRMQQLLHCIIFVSSPL